VEAGDSAALLQGNAVPVRVTGPMSRIESICEERLHFEEVALACQPGPILRIHLWATSVESTGCPVG